MTRLTWLSSSQALPQMSLLHLWAWLRQWLLSSPLTSSRSHTVSRLFHVLLNWDWDSGHWGRAGPRRSHHTDWENLTFLGIEKRHTWVCLEPVVICDKSFRANEASLCVVTQWLVLPPSSYPVVLSVSSLTQAWE